MSRTDSTGHSGPPSPLRLLAVALAVFVVPKTAWALAFTVPISTVGIRIVPGGVTVLPAVNVLGYDPTTIQAWPAQATFMALGETLQPEVTATFRDHHMENITSHPEVRYESNNPSVARVDSQGRITAVGPGEAEVWMTFRSQDAFIPVRVQAAAAIETISPLFNFDELDEFVEQIKPETTKAISVGGSARLDVEARLSDGSSGIVSAIDATRYRSDDVFVATVDARGIVYATGFGATRILVESHGVSTFALVHVGTPDVSPPSTDLQFTPEGFVDGLGGVYMSTATTVDLPSMDPSVNSAITSGLRFTGYTIDALATGIDSFETYFSMFGAIPFSLHEGAHALRYGSIDKAGNAEVVKSTFLYVDGTAPQSQFAFDGPSVATTTAWYVTSRTTVTFTAEDPVSNGVASGVRETLFGLDGGSKTLYAGGFRLAGGTHTVAYFSRDNVGNAEVERSASLTSDNEPPIVAISSPLAGERYLAGRDAIRVRFSAADNLDLAPQVEGALVELEDRGTPLGTRPVVVPVLAGEQLYPGTLDDGLWELRVTARDFLGNSTTAVSGPFEVVHDRLAPRTTLDIGTPSSGQDPVYVSSRTLLGFAAVDDLVVLGDGQGLGVLETVFAVDFGTFTVFTSSFVLADEGSHVVRYFSRDKAGNSEVALSSGIAVDATAPQLAWHVEGGSRTDTFGRLVVSTSSRIVIEAQDPLSNGVASGMSGIRYGSEGSLTWETAGSSVSFALSEGLHQVVFDGQDKVGNRSGQAGFQVLVDTTPPAFSSPEVSPAGSGQYVSASGALKTTNIDARLRAQDLVSGLGISSGRARLSKNGGATFADVGGVGISGAEGTTAPQYLSVAGLSLVESASSSQPVNILEVKAKDLALNEAVVSLGIYVDLTPPELSISTPVADALLNSRTPEIVVRYSDGVSGVDLASLRVRVDGADVAAAAGPAEARATPAPLADGSHEVRVQAADRAGNVKEAVLQFRVDATAPAITALEPPTGGYLNISSPTLRVRYADLGSGLVQGSIALTLDGSAVAAELALPPPLSEWSGVSSPPLGKFDFGIEANGDRFYVIGGRTEAGGGVTITPNVFTNTVSSAGTLGTWVETTALPEPLSAFTTSVTTAAVYVLGGYTPPFTIRNLVRYSRFNPNGSLGAWQDTSSLPVAEFGLTESVALVAGAQYIYALGGAADMSSTPRRDVYVARINADASLQAWGTTTLLPEARHNARGVYWQGRVYLIGGMRLESGIYLRSQPTVYIGQVQSNGSILSWTRGADLPEGVAHGSAVVRDGVIFYVGGTRGPSNYTSSGTYVSRIQADGSISAWQTGPWLPRASAQLAAAVVNGYVYMAGIDPAVTGFGSEARATSEVSAATASYRTAGLAEGRHETGGTARDVAGNQGVMIGAFNLDFTAPTSSLAAQGFGRSVAGRTHVSGAVPLYIDGRDPLSGGVASGVAISYLSKDSGTFSAVAGTFQLSEGTHTARFYSVDAAGNAEAPKTAVVRVDSVEPGAVADLAAFNPSTASLALAWTSRGDDASSGAIEQGDLLVRYSTYAVAFATQDAQAALGIQNQPPGTAKQLDVPSLASGTSYYFSVMTRDTAGNYSAGSNVAVARTMSLAASPDGLASLISPEPGFSADFVQTASAPGAYGVLSSQGLRLLMAGFYDFARPAGQPAGSPEVQFSTPATVSFVFDPQGANLGMVGIYRFDGAAWSSGPVTGQSMTAMAGGLYEIKGQLRSASLYGVFEFADRLPPLTSLSVGSPKHEPEGSPTGGPVYISSETLLQLSSLDDLAVPGDGMGLGVKSHALNVAGVLRSEWLNPQPAKGAAFVSGLRLAADADGLKSLSWWSSDVAGNRSELKTSSVALDNTPPLTSLAVVGGPQAAGPDPASFYVSSTALLGLPAGDPTAGGVASGLGWTRYQDNNGAFQAYVSSFSLPEGSHLLAYQSQDRVENFEVLRSTTVLVDATPPATVFELRPPGFTAGDATLYVTPATSMTFTASDPMSAGVASGLDRIEADVDGAGFSRYVGPLSFAEGRHVVRFRAVDRVGNVGAVQTLSLRSDATPPLTSLEPSGDFFTASGPEGPRRYAPLGFTYGLAAADPTVNDVASGLALTLFGIDSAALQPYASRFSLAEGIRVVEYQSRDNVGNLEPKKSAAVLVDATAPATALAIGAPKFDPGDGRPVFVSSRTSFTLNSQDPVVREVAAGPRQASFRQSAGAFGLYAGPFTLNLPDGLKTLEWFSEDNVGNLEPAKSTAAALDATAPVTSLVVMAGRQAPGPDAASFYASLGTRYALQAQDAPAGGATSGLAFTRFQDNGGAFQTFGSDFSLSEGSHLLGYQSQDMVENLEVLRSTSVLVDATPPVTASAIGSPHFVSTDGAHYITPQTQVALSAQDQLMSGVASGLDRIEADIDGTGFVAYVSSLTFAEGRHALGYCGLDRVGNMEPAHALELRVDDTPPVSSLAVGQPIFTAPDGTQFLTPATVVALSAADPVVQGAASGVERIETSLDGGGFAAYTQGVSFAEGRHVLAYRAVDNVGHVESARSFTFQVDATAPVSTAHIGEPAFTAQDGTRYVTPRTAMVFTADDPVQAQAASGVGRIEVDVDGAGFTAYVSTLAFAEGRHTVKFRAIDRVGNVEPFQFLSLQSDAAPPLTSLEPSGEFYTVSGPDGLRLYAPQGFTYGLPAADPTVNDVSSGVALTLFGIDFGALQPFTSRFGLAEGIRRVGYQSQDNVGNVELLRSATIYVDATAPSSVLAIGAPKFDPGDGRPVFVGPGTLLSLAGQDPEVQGVASGLAEVKFRVQAGAFGTFTAPFMLPLPDGLKSLEWHAADNVGNRENVRVSTVALDATAPLTSLAVVGGRQAPGPDLASFYVSSGAMLGLPAVDPAVGEIASGLAFTRFQDNNGAFQAFISSFALPEGSHLLAYRSQDNVENLEVLRSTTVLVDATAPGSELVLSGPRAEITSTQGTGPVGLTVVAARTGLEVRAEDPVVRGAGSGVERVLVSTGADFQVQSGPFNLLGPDGAKTVSYYGLDRVGNTEILKSRALGLDNTAPETTLAMLGGYRSQGSQLYASSTTAYRLEAQDPAGNGIASGVDAEFYAVDAGPVTTFAEDLFLEEGIRGVAFYSRDRVENAESLKSAAIRVDSTPPVTEWVLEGPRYEAVQGDPASIGGPLFIASHTLVAFKSLDPVSREVASGVSRTLYGLDTADLGVYGSSFSIVQESTHTVYFRSLDNVENLEAVKSFAVSVDSTAPSTAMSFQGPYHVRQSGLVFVATATVVLLDGRDPLSNGVAAGLPEGLLATRYRVDNGPWSGFAGEFKLGLGAHSVEYLSTDRLGNAEAARSATVTVDGQAPLITALSPAGGEVFFVAGAPITIGFAVQDNLDTAPVVEAVLVEVEDRGLPAGARPGLVAVEAGQVMNPAELDDGMWELRVLARDFVANTSTAASGRFEVVHDVLPPRTSLALGEPSMAGLPAGSPAGEPAYVSSETLMGLSAIDDLLSVGDGQGLGVATTSWSLDGAGFERYASSFSIGTEGVHSLAYFSADVAGNTEAVRTSTVAVDTSAPETVVLGATVVFRSASGLDFIGPSAAIGFVGHDPVSAGVASGVKLTRYRLNNGPFQVFESAIMLGEGSSLLAWQSQDRVDNFEALKSTTVAVDRSAPLTSFAFVGGVQYATGTAAAPAALPLVYASGDTGLALSATDPEVSGVASGVKETLFSLDAGQYSRYVSTVTGLSEGARVLGFLSVDNAGNRELARTLAVFVDTTPPTSTLRIGEPRSRAFGLDMLTSQTPVSLSAEDPVSAGGASGVSRIAYRVDGGAWQVYAGTFTLGQAGLADGTHLLEYKAVDHVGNAEPIKSATLLVANFITAAVAGVDGVDGSGNAFMSGSVESNKTITLTGNARIAGDAAAMTVLVKGNAAITGTLTQGVSPLSPEPLDMALIEQLARASSSNALIPLEFLKDGSLVLTGARSLVLSTGSYVVEGLSITGSANLGVAGPVSLLVWGQVKVEGYGKMNASGRASDLMVFSRSVAGVQFGGSAQAVATFYNAAGGVDMAGTASLAGHVFAKSAKLAGSARLESGEALGRRLTTAMGPEPGSQTADTLQADPTFTFRNAYAYPNPAVGSQKPVIRAMVGLADTVRIEVFDMSGRKVREAQVTGQPRVVDDGTGPKYAYDYVWDGRIASGVYIFTIKAEKAGYAPIRKTGRFGVVR